MSSECILLLTAIGTCLGGFGACAAAYYSFRSSSQNQESISLQQEISKNAIRPVLGFKEAIASYTENGVYPVHLSFNNHGKGAAWVSKIECNLENGSTIEAHVGTPVCVGPLEYGSVKLFLPKKDIMHKVNLRLYYWDINDDAHCTKIVADIRWQSKVNPLSDVFIYSELITHDLNMDRPNSIEHQSS